MFFTAVTNGDEFVEQAAVFFQYGEITLMFTHRGDDAFFGQSQEFIFEFAAQSSGPFYQVVNFFKQVFVDFSVTAFFNSKVDYLLTDKFTTSVLVNHYEVVHQNLFVSFSAGNFYNTSSFVDSRSNSIFYSANSFFQQFFCIVKAFDSFCFFYESRTQEAVTTRKFAGFNASDFYGNYFIAKESNHPANRTNKTEIKVSPTHGFGEVQGSEDILEQAGKQSFNFLTSQMFYSENIAITNFQIFNSNALATSKALSSFGSFAVFECDLHGRTFSFNGAICLMFSNAVSDEGHTARSAIYSNCFIRNAQFVHFLFSQLFQLSHDTGHKLRRDFFSTNFK